MFHPKQKATLVCVDEQQPLPEVPRLQLVASVKVEAVAFFYEHGCAIQQRQKHHQDDLVIFTAGSRQEPLSPTSKRCSHIILPDGTCITAIDCYTRSIFLLIDPIQCSCIHLSR